MFPSWNKATEDLVSLNPKETSLVGILAAQLGYMELRIVHSHQCYELKHWISLNLAKTLSASSSDDNTGRCGYNLWRIGMDRMEGGGEEMCVSPLMSVIDC